MNKTQTLPLGTQTLPLVHRQAKRGNSEEGISLSMADANMKEILPEEISEAHSLKLINKVFMSPDSTV